ncbi:MAG: hypothetical protein U9M92_02330 [Patescibacteria group bacterium]|nr:hypothetical protein [Patescibacteria group bacterium]
MDSLLTKINTELLNPFIALLFALALVFFLYGVYEYVKGADSGTIRETGKMHMIWGVVGMAIMVSAFGIMGVICKTIGSC